MLAIRNTNAIEKKILEKVYLGLLRNAVAWIMKACVQKNKFTNELDLKGIVFPLKDKECYHKTHYEPKESKNNKN